MKSIAIIHYNELLQGFCLFVCLFSAQPVNVMSFNKLPVVAFIITCSPFRYIYTGYLKGSSQMRAIDLKRHSSSSVFISSHRPNSAGPSSPPVLLETGDLDQSSSGSTSNLPGRNGHRVSFEGDDKIRIQEVTKTPKPRHKPRRVKTDLGDNKSILTALHRKSAPACTSLGKIKKRNKVLGFSQRCVIDPNVLSVWINDLTFSAGIFSPTIPRGAKNKESSNFFIS